jgi:hypothetical protein
MALAAGNSTDRNAPRTVRPCPQHLAPKMCQRASEDLQLTAFMAVSVSDIGGMHSIKGSIPPKIPPAPLRWKTRLQQNQTPAIAIFRCGRARSNPRPQLGFEVANEGSIAYARVVQ